MKKIHRLLKKEQFSEVIQKGETLKNKSFVVHYLKSEVNSKRIGITASTKLGHAVVRNRIKRQIRSMCDSLVDYTNNPIDIVIIARMGFLELSYSENLKNLDNLLSSIR